MATYVYIWIHAQWIDIYCNLILSQKEENCYHHENAVWYYQVALSVPILMKLFSGLLKGKFGQWRSWNFGAFFFLFYAFCILFYSS